MRRLISLFMALIFSVSLLTVAYAADPSAISGDPIYTEAFNWAAENNLMNDFESDTFNPRAIFTRSQAVAVLWQAAGEPSPTLESHSFRDVSPTMSDYLAILWAVEKGITVGCTDYTFEPDALCTNAQFLTFLWRAEGMPAAAAASSLAAANSGTYYTDALAWADTTGVLYRSYDTFYASAPATCADIVTYLYLKSVPWVTEDTPLAGAASGQLFISQQPESAAAEGGMVSFTVQASGGKAPYSYAWESRSGTGSWYRVYDTTSNTLTKFPAASMISSGLYFRCVVSDAAGNKVTSDEAKVLEPGESYTGGSQNSNPPADSSSQPITPLTIKTQPQDAAFAGDGAQVSFKVEVSGGKPPYSYAWESKSGSGSWYRVYDTTTNILTKYPAASMVSSGLSFRCVISDAAGNKVTSGEAKVLSSGGSAGSQGTNPTPPAGNTSQGAKPLTITAHPQNATLAGDYADVTFKVEVTGGTPPYTYRWEDKNMYLDWAHVYDSPSSNTLFYPITLGSAQNDFRFRCVITDAKGNSVTSNEASIIYTGDHPSLGALTIEEMPIDVSCVAGETVKLTVLNVGGTKPIHHVWEYRTDLIGWTKFHEATPGSVAFLKTTQELLDNGLQVRCTVTDSKGGYAVSDTARVLELDTPQDGTLQITRQPQSVSGSGYSNGDSVIYSVEVSGGVAPYSYHWQVYSVPYDEDDARYTGFYDIEETPGGWAVGYTTAQLAIPFDEGLLEDDFQFCCVITDAKGNTVVTEPVGFTDAYTGPIITRQPAGVVFYTDWYDVVDATTTADFFAIAINGKAPLTYQWQYCPAGQDEFIDFSSADSSWAWNYNTINLTVLARPNFGFSNSTGYQSPSYRCKITAADGQVIYSKSAFTMIYD